MFIIITFYVYVRYRPVSPQFLSTYKQLINPFKVKSQVTYHKIRLQALRDRLDTSHDLDKFVQRLPDFAIMHVLHLVLVKEIPKE